MRQYTPEPRTYELMTVLSPDVPEDDISGVLDAISGYVTDAGGSVQAVLRDSPWGRRRLAYPIRHAGRDVRDGYYTLYQLELAPSRVTDVERDLKLNTQVIRYLMTHHTPAPIDPRAEMDAEIDAEEAAAAAYAAAQAASAAPAVTSDQDGDVEPGGAAATDAAPTGRDEAAAPSETIDAPTADLDATSAPSAPAPTAEAPGSQETDAATPGATTVRVADGTGEG